VDCQGGVFEPSTEDQSAKEGQIQQRRIGHSLDLSYIVDRLAMADQEQSHCTGGEEARVRRMED